MPAIKTLEVVARPSKKEAGSTFWSTSFWMFGSDEESGAKRTTIESETAKELFVKMNEWAATLPTPEIAGAEMVGYSVTVMKPARWANGYKRFERAAMIMARTEVK